MYRSDFRDDGRTIAINVGYEGMQYGSQSRTLDALCDCLKHLRSLKFRFEFFAMHQADHQPLEAVRRRLRLEDAPIWSHSIKTSEWLKRLSRAHLVIGQRLHAVISASGLGIPPISIAYRNKCLSFMRDIGLDEYALKTDEISSAKLTDMAVSALDRSEAIRKQLRVSVAEQVHLQEQAAETARQVILSM
jgi:polysaccharide pyruvyl transferase WcaK-like protein